MKILEGRLAEGDTVEVDVEKGQLVFRRVLVAEAA
jgi:hypothetical protein